MENAKKVIEGEYAWNNSKVENYLKELTEDSTATFSPLASNILIKKIDTTYHLVNQWTICTIDTLNGIDEYIVDVDAFSGNVINVNKEIFNSIGNCENAEVITLYYGRQYDMKTKHIAPWVYGLKNCNKLATTDFINLTRYTFGQTSFLVDSDNIWTSVEERPATTAHWAACKIQNYFINKCSLGGRPIQLIVNSTKHNNAYYSIDYFSSISGRNSYNKIEIGISDRGNYYSTVDIIAHEYGHGIIRHTSNLDNKGESGAINESFADIFAILAENHILGRNDWTIGEDVGEILRDVKNPICDYYLGTNWVNTSDVSSSNDNGGIHTNSGVQNRWFFLVASEIGLNKAGKLAFATQKILNRTSKYRDVRNLSIILAENLWGRCSEEYNAVVEAWYEVGVSLRNATWYCSNGHHIMPNMFLPKFVDCSLNNTISIYPNPVGNLLFVDLPQKATVCIVDVNGQTLHAYELDKGRHSIDVSNLISGVYFVRCNNEVEKIVKIK